MSDEIIYPTGTTCEISPHRPTKDTSMPQRSMPNLYNQLRDAKNKAEVIECLRRSGWIPWNDVPQDVIEKLNRMSSTAQ